MQGLDSGRSRKCIIKTSSELPQASKTPISASKKCSIFSAQSVPMRLKQIATSRGVQFHARASGSLAQPREQAGSFDGSAALERPGPRGVLDGARARPRGILGMHLLAEGISPGHLDLLVEAFTLSNFLAADVNSRRSSVVPQDRPDLDFSSAAWSAASLHLCAARRAGRHAAPTPSLHDAGRTVMCPPAEVPPRGPACDA